MIRPANLRNQRWQVAPAVPEALRRQMNHLHPTLLQVLFNRGQQSRGQIEAFLASQYLGDRDPFLLGDMDRAVGRIRQAIHDDELIVVYGDFDADGVTATVLLVEALRRLGIERQQVLPYIPDRVDEGYGLNVEALQHLKERGAGLVITVDCGIRSVREVEAANALGMDVIITDHHSLGAVLPPAAAIVNPKRPESAYPERALAGVGIAFKLAQALRLALPEKAEYEDAQFLDLVALGTVADLAPLLGENRRLVIEGLSVLNECRRPGVAALADVAGLRPGKMTAESIAFGLAPRLNAAGRLAHAYDAARLLAANNAPAAREHAAELNRLNRERQRLTADLSRAAEDLVDPAEPLLFAADPGFQSGVVGLVASRLADRFYRPAIVVEQGDVESRGSCRSIPEFDITAALDQVSDLLIRHGGHHQAAGFTIRTDLLPEFRARMMTLAAEALDPAALQPTLTIDAELPVAGVDWALQQVLGEKLEPTGTANSPPLFMSRNVQVYGHRLVGKDQNHLQIWVGDGQMKLGSIAFGQGAWAGCLPGRVDLAYTIGVNEWNGRRDLQLQIQDIREPETA